MAKFRMVEETYYPKVMYNDFRSNLSKRSQIQLEEQYEAAILNNEMVVFVRDNEKRDLVSYSLEYREND
jgi:hypothetical protein